MFIYCANIHFGTLKGISRCNMILLDCIKMGGMSFILHKKNADGLRTPHCLFHPLRFLLHFDFSKKKGLKY